MMIEIALERAAGVLATDALKCSLDASLKPACDRAVEAIESDYYRVRP